MCDELEAGATGHWSKWKLEQVEIGATGDWSMWKLETESLEASKIFNEQIFLFLFLEPFHPANPTLITFTSPQADKRRVTRYLATTSEITISCDILAT